MLLRAHSTSTPPLGIPGTQTPGHHRAGSPARARKEREFLLQEQQTPKSRRPLEAEPLHSLLPPCRYQDPLHLRQAQLPTCPCRRRCPRGLPARPALLTHRSLLRPAPPHPSCHAAPRLLPAPSLYPSKLLLSCATRLLATGKNRKRTEVTLDPSNTQQGLPGCLGFPGTEQRRGLAAAPRRRTAGTGRRSLSGDLLLGPSPDSLATLRALSMLVPGRRAGGSLSRSWAAPTPCRERGWPDAGAGGVDNDGKLTSGRVRTSSDATKPVLSPLCSRRGVYEQGAPGGAEPVPPARVIGLPALGPRAPGAAACAAAPAWPASTHRQPPAGPPRRSRWPPRPP